MLKIAIITGSTRPGRVNEQVAKWVLKEAQKRGDAEYTLVDIQDMNLPLLDEGIPAAYNQYQQPHTKAWAKTVGQYDGYVIVTPEYNHSTSAALKNALGKGAFQRVYITTGSGSVFLKRAVVPRQQKKKLMEWVGNEFSDVEAPDDQLLFDIVPLENLGPDKGEAALLRSR